MQVAMIGIESAGDCFAEAVCELSADRSDGPSLSSLFANAGLLFRSQLVVHAWLHGLERLHNQADTSAARRHILPGPAFRRVDAADNFRVAPAKRDSIRALIAVARVA
jgi:hypothetical protein